MALSALPLFTLLGGGLAVYALTRNANASTPPRGGYVPPEDAYPPRPPPGGFRAPEGNYPPPRGHGGPRPVPFPVPPSPPPPGPFPVPPSPPPPGPPGGIGLTLPPGMPMPTSHPNPTRYEMQSRQLLDWARDRVELPPPLRQVVADQLALATARDLYALQELAFWLAQAGYRQAAQAAQNRIGEVALLAQPGSGAETFYSAWPLMTFDAGTPVALRASILDAGMAMSLSELNELRNYAVPYPETTRTIESLTRFPAIVREKGGVVPVPEPPPPPVGTGPGPWSPPGPWPPGPGARTPPAVVIAPPQRLPPGYGAPPMPPPQPAPPQPPPPQPAPPAAVPPPVPALPPGAHQQADGTVRYEIQPGDTAVRIVEKFGRKPGDHYVRYLFRANPGIKKWNTIYPGQVLVVPPEVVTTGATPLVIEPPKPAKPVEPAEPGEPFGPPPPPSPQDLLTPPEDPLATTKDAGGWLPPWLNLDDVLLKSRNRLSQEGPPRPAEPAPGAGPLQPQGMAVAPPPGGARPRPPVQAALPAVQPSAVPAAGLPEGTVRSPDGGARYTVRRGDYPDKIGQRFGRAKGAGRELVAFNPAIKDWRKLQPGQAVAIPPAWLTRN